MPTKTKAKPAAEAPPPETAPEPQAVRAGVIDFDAALAEIEQRTVTIKLFGKEWEIPASIPAMIPLKTLRTMRESGPSARFDPLELYKMADACFGSDNLTAWCNDYALTEEQMAALVLHRFKGLLTVVENGTARPNRRSRRASTSSNAGRK